MKCRVSAPQTTPEVAAAFVRDLFAGVPMNEEERKEIFKRLWYHNDHPHEPVKWTPEQWQEFTTLILKGEA